MHLEVLKENLNISKATICNISLGGRITHRIEYFFVFKNKIYKSHLYPPKDPVIGEKFLVEFDSLNPTKSKIKTDSPLFLPNEVTKYTVGYLDKLNTTFFKSILFTYYINGEEYKQWYDPIEGINEKYPNFVEGKNYIVKYWVENPERSIILPDQPTNLPLGYDGDIILK